MKHNRIVFYLLSGLYVLLMLFGVISIYNPGWLQTLSEPGRATEAKTNIEKANEYMYHGNFNQALVLYREALKIDTANRNTYGNMANALIGQYHLASKCLDEVVRLSVNKDSLAFYNYYISKGDLEKAVGNEEIRKNLDGNSNLERSLQYYKQAIDIMPYEVNLYYRHAHLAKQMGKDSLAIEGFRKGIEKNESLGIFYYGALFNEYLVSLSNNDTATADDIKYILYSHNTIPWHKYDTLSLKEYRQKDAYIALAYANLGELLLRAGKKESAESAFNKSMVLNPALRQMISQIRSKY
jgi:tetratricopeptide (TPR) repeat protein